MSSTSSATSTALTRDNPVTARRSRLTPSREAAWLWRASLVFISAACWWLSQDDRIPDFDSGLHIAIADADRVAIATGYFSGPFTGRAPVMWPPAPAG